MIEWTVVGFVYLGCKEIANGIEALWSLKSIGVHNVEAIQIDFSDIASEVLAKK